MDKGILTAIHDTEKFYKLKTKWIYMILMPALALNSVGLREQTGEWEHF